jgi:predicted transcriptional regulator
LTQTADSSNFKDQIITFSLLHELLDNTGCEIIMSIADIPKAASQICHENNLPQSSAYKKIKKLLNTGLIAIERISIDDKGKRVVFYRSKVESLEFNLQRGGIFMKFNTNNIKR